LILQKVFFTSDLHFGHENVLRFDNRPFSSVEEMDAELVRRWNTKVGKGDLVYVLGDLIWKSRNGDAHNLIKSLNGQIILIKGNHDRFLHNAQAKAALAGIKDYDDICVTLEDGSVRRCILSHYFIPFYNGHRYQAIHLHGHSHFTDEADLELKMAKELNEIGFKSEIYNVGCMYWDYAPVTLDEILSQTVRASEPKYETIELTIDSDLHEQAGEVFKRYGLTHEEAIQLFFTETVRLGRIPFDYTPEDLAEAKRLCGGADEDGE
jgi:addiction module RelB/DinJ family antitoxin